MAARLFQRQAARSTGNRARAPNAELADIFVDSGGEKRHSPPFADDQ
jgi:hypothetical protein